MSHPEQLAFFSSVATSNPETTSGSRILEIGSYDVNGSMRSLFPHAGVYVGVDLTQGPGVDVVSYGHLIDHPAGAYDIAVSGECFEHDPHWRETFENMTRLTRAGGIVAFSCASHGRVEHGTRRSDVTDSPGTQSVGLDYYRNLVEADFDVAMLNDRFSVWRFWTMPTTFDLYFMGVRAGVASPARLPEDATIEKIRGLLPPVHRLLRLPLRVVAKVVDDEDRYQRIVLPYWRFLLRRAGQRRRTA